MKESASVWLLLALLCVIPEKSLQDLTNKERLITVGLVLPVHEAGTSGATCGHLVPGRALAVSQFIRLVDHLNAAEFLPGGFRLTFDVVDTCSSSSYTMAQIGKWGSLKLSNTGPPLGFVISNGQDDFTPAMAVWFRQFGIPLIDFNSTAAELSDRIRYPLLARTIASDKMKAQVLAVLIANVFEWNQVNLVYSSGLMGESGARALRYELAKLGISVAGDIQIPLHTSNGAGGQFVHIVNRLDRSDDIPGVVCFCTHEDTLALMKTMRNVFSSSKSSLPLPKHVLLTSASFEEKFDFSLNELPPDALVSIVNWNENPPTNFVKWYSANYPSSSNDNPFLVPADKFHPASSSFITEDSALGSLTNAVLAGAYALRAMIDARFCQHGSFDENCTMVTGITPRLLQDFIQNGSLFYNTYLRHISFDVPVLNGGNYSSVYEPFSFDSLVELPAFYKFVIFAEEINNNSESIIVKEEFGDFSASRKHLNLLCSDLISKLLFTEHHVDCRRENRDDIGKTKSNSGNNNGLIQQTMTLSYHYEEDSRNNLMIILIPAISFGSFLAISVGVALFYLRQSKSADNNRRPRRREGNVIVLHELPPATLVPIFGNDDDNTTAGSRSTNLAVNIVDEVEEESRPLSPNSDSITNNCVTSSNNAQ